MLVRPQTILAAFGSPAPRNKIGAKGIQIYAPGGIHWSKKPLILRNAPYTIEDPTPAQITTRLNLADVASRAKGERGFIEGLPAVAYRVKEALTGTRTAFTKSPEEYLSRGSFHTVDDLRKMLKEKTAKAREEIEEYERARAAAPPARF